MIYCLLFIQLCMGMIQKELPMIPRPIHPYFASKPKSDSILPNQLHSSRQSSRATDFRSLMTPVPIDYVALRDQNLEQLFRNLESEKRLKDSIPVLEAELSSLNALKESSSSFHDPQDLESKIQKQEALLKIEQNLIQHKKDSINIFFNLAKNYHSSAKKNGLITPESTLKLKNIFNNIGHNYDLKEKDVKLYSDHFNKNK